MTITEFIVGFIVATAIYDVLLLAVKYLYKTYYLIPKLQKQFKSVNDYIDTILDKTNDKNSNSGSFH